MKSKAFELGMIYLCIGLFVIYLTSALLPIWASIAISTVAVLTTVILSGNLGCSMILALPIIFFGSIFVVGLLKLDFATALFVSFSTVLVILIYTAENFISITAMIGLGVYLTFVKSHNPFFDSLFFATVILCWYISKMKRIKLGRLAQYLLVVLTVSILVSRLDVYPLKTLLTRLQPFEQTSRQEIQIEEQISIGTKASRQFSTETRPNWLNKLVEKIWIPLTLLLFGVFLFTFAITNFGIKGTLRLLLLGALFFIAFTTVASMIFRSIKPGYELFPPEQSYEVRLEAQQGVEQVMVKEQKITTEESFETVSYNLTLILDLLTLSLLVFMTILVVNYVLKSRLKLENEKTTARGEQIPQDVELYPLDKIPEFVQTEDFIKSAYWWLRRKYFPTLHHLTPRELIDSTNLQIKSFEDLTLIYEKVRYAGKGIEKEELEKFYQDLLETVAGIEKTRFSEADKEKSQGV